MREYWFENGSNPNETTYHSEKFLDVNECKSKAIEYVTANQEDVTILLEDTDSTFAGHGRVLTKCMFVDGEAVIKPY